MTLCSLTLLHYAMQRNKPKGEWGAAKAGALEPSGEPPGGLGGEQGMPTRVETLRFDPARQAFDDGPWQEFLKAKEVQAIRIFFSGAAGTQGQPSDSSAMS